MTDTALLHIQNPRAFLVPAVNAFVLKALSSSPLIEDPAAALLELVDYVEHPRMGLFVVREGAELKGLALVEHSGSALMPGATVLHFYNEGGPKARKELVAGVVDFAKTHGASKIWGIDINQRPRGFGRLFRAVGLFTSRGHLYQIDIAEGAE